MAEFYYKSWDGTQPSNRKRPTTISPSNFKCPVSGKEFFISDWKSKMENGQMAYYERRSGWYPLVNPENGTLLAKIEPKEVHITSVKTDTASR